MSPEQSSFFACIFLFLFFFFFKSVARWKIWLLAELAASAEAVVNEQTCGGRTVIHIPLYQVVTLGIGHNHIEEIYLKTNVSSQVTLKEGLYISLLSSRTS